MGAPHLRPSVPHDRSRRGRARRVPGNVPARISRAPGVSRAGEVLILAVPDRVESVSRLGPPRTAGPRRSGAGGRGSHGTGGRGGAVRGDRGTRPPQGPLTRGRNGDEDAA